MTFKATNKQFLTPPYDRKGFQAPFDSLLSTAIIAVSIPEMF